MHRRFTALVVCGVFAAAQAALGQTYLVKDVNDAPGGQYNSTPATSFAPLPGGRALYTTRLGFYTTDGTPEGTSAMGYSGTPFIARQGVVLGGFTYFSGSDNLLWRTDGTAAGTQLVRTGAGHTIGHSNSNTIHLQNGRIFGMGPVNGQTVLWSTDGTPEGFGSSAFPVSGSRYLQNWGYAAVAGGKTYLLLVPQFSTEDYQLWVCDTAASSPPQFVEATPLSLNVSPPGPLFSDGARLFYPRPINDATRMLWTLDPAIDVSTTVPGAMIPNSFVSFRGVSGGRVVYTVVNSSATPAIRQIWAASETGAELIREGLEPATYVSAGGLLFFDQLINGQARVWRTDGTAAGTWSVNAPLPAGALARERALTAVGDECWFLVDDGVEDAWWSWDGFAPAPTRMTTQPPVGPGGSRVDFSTLRIGLSSRVLYNCTVGTLGEEVWTSDGTPEGTEVLADLSSATVNSTPAWFTPVGENGDVLFTAVKDSASKLFRTDGSRAGTVEVPPPASSGRATLGPGMLFAAPPGILFNGSAPVGETGTRLWASDGTSEGTVLLGPANAARFFGYAELHPAFAKLDDGIVYYPASDTADGVQLWRTDGTPEGTAKVTTRAAGFNFTGMGEFARVSAGRMVFFAETTAVGYELWTSDGTAGGTALVSNLTAGAGSTFCDVMSPGPGFAIFQGPNGVWRTDGTAAGTFVLLPLNESFDRVTIGNRMFVAMHFGDRTVRVTDGTVAGTTVLTGLNATALGRLGNRCLVASTNGLWITDGMLAGTTNLSPVPPTPRPGARPTFFEGPPGDAATYYFVDSGVNAGLWRTDGTPTGTQRWRTLAPALGGEQPAPSSSGVVGADHWARFAGSRLIFRGSTQGVGIEPWAIDVRPSTDCDEDGRQDQAELAVGDERDVNADGVIDSCQCLADWNSSGSPVTVQDIYDFLEDWLSSEADYNAEGGTTVQDIYDFLEAWLTGC